MKPARLQRSYRTLVRLAFQESFTNEALDGAKVLAWVKLLAQRNAKEAVVLLRAYRNRIISQLARETARVQSPNPLDEVSQQELLSCLKSRFPWVKKLASGEDPNLLGGLVIRIGDTIWDGSLKTKLSLLER